jgi:hypothetical protein
MTLPPLQNPKKIQDFINTFGKRSPNERHIVRSPKHVLADGTASCMEGALVAAAALIALGEKPLLLDLKVGARNNSDVDHVVTLFKKHGHYGALSKTRHAVLRYREPVYKTVRELALSYFHEYFTDDGRKTLRSYSDPFDLSKHAPHGWMDTDEDLYLVAAALDASPHHAILSPAMARDLRLADPIEREAGRIVEPD